MNRRSTRSFFGITAQTVQQNKIIQIPDTLNTEKNELIGIMSQYLTKKNDRVETVSRLTKLEETLSKPS
jgi:hypothetical protein